MRHDQLGREMTEAENALLEAYEKVKSVLALGDLSPCVRANVQESLAALWQAVNDLALLEERPNL